MRVFRLFVLLVFILPLGMLFRLPGMMAEDYVVTKLTDAAAEYVGVNKTFPEEVIHYVWPLVPFLAAAATLMLYHAISEVVSPKNIHPVAEVPARKPKIKMMADAASLLLVVFFVCVVLYSEYTFRFPASDALRYHYISQLSNSGLREAAFNVSHKLEDLDQEYEARKSGIMAQFYKEKRQWDAKKAAYQKAMDTYKSQLISYQQAQAAYSNWAATHSYNSLTGTWSSTLFGGTEFVLGHPQQHEQAPQVPDKPTEPDGPGDAPKAPIITVDSDWKQRAEAVQTQAAAVWEEICHRLGYYPRLFIVPSTYSGDGLEVQIMRIQKLGNQLH